MNLVDKITKLTGKNLYYIISMLYYIMYIIGMAVKGDRGWKSVDHV